MEATRRSLRWAAPRSDFGPFSQDEGIFDVPPRYLTVFSIFVWPSRIWIARRFPVAL
jgi:hypothetical protein